MKCEARGKYVDGRGIRRRGGQGEIVEDYLIYLGFDSNSVPGVTVI